MGGCATKFKVLQDAPPPAPAPADDVAVAGDNEPKRQSLGHLFKENEVAEEKDALEQVKRENPAEAKPQETEIANSQVADVPATDSKNAEAFEEKNIEEVKPATQIAEMERSRNKTEEIVEEKRVLEDTKVASDAVQPKA